MQGLEGHSIVKAAMGEYHGVAIDDAGAVFVWGSMVEGLGQVDGLPGVDQEHTATPLKGMPECTVATAVACGHEHSVLLTQEDPCCAGEDPEGCTVAATASSTAKATAVEEPNTEPESVLRSDADSGLPVDTSSKSAVASVAVAAAGMLRGSSTPPMDAPDIQPTPSIPTVSPQSAIFHAEQCANGAPRPAWISSCDSIPGAVPALDRAWYGRYKAPTLDKVSSSISQYPVQKEQEAPSAEGGVFHAGDANST